MIAHCRHLFAEREKDIGLAHWRHRSRSGWDLDMSAWGRSGPAGSAVVAIQELNRDIYPDQNTVKPVKCSLGHCRHLESESVEEGENSGDVESDGC